MYKHLAIPYEKDKKKYIKECDVYSFDTFSANYNYILETKDIECTWIQTQRKSEHKNRKYFASLPMGFDCETTKVNEDTTFCYLWQFSLCDIVIVSDNMHELSQLLDIIETVFIPQKKEESDEYIFTIFDMNLNYEFMFFKHYLTITDSFFKERTAPMYFVAQEHFRFLECISWGGSLQGLAKTYTNLVKLKGDLDFSIYRESYKDFTKDEEWHYICFDVLILSQFATWYYENYLYKYKFCPLSLQNFIRKQFELNGLQANKNADALQIEDRTFYDEIMAYLYRGGYVHANANYSLNTLEFNPLDFNTIHLLSFDKTSSYPWSMYSHKFPCSKMIEYNFNEDDIKDYINVYRIGEEYNHEHGFIIKATFYNIETKKINGEYTNNIESKSKILDYENAKFDNGRLYKADFITVWLTELDYLLYTRYYNYELCDVEKCYCFRLGWLPRYILDVMINPYKNKYYLKCKGLPYMIEKVNCNSIYGVFCTKAPNNELIWNDDLKVFEEGTKSKQDLYNSFIKMNSQYSHNYITPFYGIYTSAWSRYDLLDTCYELSINNCPCLYEDTDSLKTLDYQGNARKIIDRRNAIIRKAIEQRTKDLNEDIEVFAPSKDGDVIGCWDEEYSEGITRFKSLGCKRYLVEYYETNKDTKQKEKVIKMACSGLDGKAFFDYCKKQNKDAFELFNNGLCVPGCRKTHKYINDERIITSRTGAPIYIPSNVTLNDSDFTMEVKDDYISMCKEFSRLLAYKDSRISQTSAILRFIQNAQ